VKDFFNNIKSLPFKTKGDESSRYYDCPLCRGREKLEVHNTRPVWYCHKCGIGGRIPGSGRNPPEPLNYLLSTTLWADDGDFLSAYSKLTSHSTSKLITYLWKERGLSEDKIKELQPHRGPSPLRVYLPLFRLGSSIPCYFVGRAIVNMDIFPSWMNPSLKMFGVRKSELLWGVHRIKGKVDNLILCEGIFDAVHYPNALALLGKTISKEQVETVRRIGPKEITVVLDGDATGETIKVSISLKDIAPTYRIQLPWSKDPDTIRDRDLDPWMKRRIRTA